MQAVVYGTPLATLKASETWKCFQLAITVIAHSFFGLHFFWYRWSGSPAFTHTPWIMAIQWIIL